VSSHFGHFPGLDKWINTSYEEGSKAMSEKNYSKMQILLDVMELDRRHEKQ